MKNMQEEPNKTIIKCLDFLHNFSFLKQLHIIPVF